MCSMGSKNKRIGLVFPLISEGTLYTDFSKIMNLDPYRNSRFKPYYATSAIFTHTHTHRQTLEHQWY